MKDYKLCGHAIPQGWCGHCLSETNSTDHWKTRCEELEQQVHDWRASSIHFEADTVRKLFTITLLEFKLSQAVEGLERAKNAKYYSVDNEQTYFEICEEVLGRVKG